MAAKIEEKLEELRKQQFEKQKAAWEAYGKAMGFI